MDIASLDLKVFHQIVVHVYPNHKFVKVKLIKKIPYSYKKLLYGKQKAAWASHVLFSLNNKKEKKKG